MPRFRFDSHRGGSKRFMGRFGGGWDYIVGVQLSGFRRPGSLIVNLLLCSIRIDWPGAP